MSERTTTRNNDFYNKENKSNNIQREMKPYYNQQEKSFSGSNSNSTSTRGRGRAGPVVQNSNPRDQMQNTSRGGYGRGGMNNNMGARSEAGFDGKSMKSSASFAYSTPQSTPQYSEHESFQGGR